MRSPSLAPADADSIAAIKELRATNQFEALAQEDDEAEHSLEMHLPYVRKMFEG